MNFKQSTKKTKFKKFFLELVIIFIKLLVFFSKSLLSLVLVVKKPTKSLARLFFYKVVVKIYCFYLSLVKKLGFSRKKKSFLSFLFNEKITHVVIVTLTILIVLTNITPFVSANSFSDKQKQPIVYSLVQSEFGGLDQGEEIIEEYFDEEVLRNHAFSQKKYIDQQLALGGGPSFDSQILENDIPVNRVTETGLSEAENLVVEERNEIIEYEVQPGDVVGVIASKFGVSVNTILWENNLGSYDLIRPGDKLTILPITGIRHEVSRGESLSLIANKYDVSEKEISEQNNLINPERLSIGDKLIIPGGRKPSVVKPKSPSQTALTVVRDIVKPQPEVQPTVAPSGKMHWPTTGHRITQYYSWRHQGLDIADKTGTPLFAAEAGVVELVGWNTGYGNNIIIDHGGGRKTRYAHMNRFYVNRGQRVNRGQTLGEMGNTGWSTGPHIHFEVIVNGARQNPLNYLR